MSNLRGAPLFLQPALVEALVSEVSLVAKGMANIELMLTELVDRPRRSEDPRLAKANDDVAEPDAAPEFEGWPDAPLPDHADPDLDRPEPAQIARRKSRATGVRAAQIAAKAERDQQLLELYAAGADVADLAARFDLAVCTVREMARAAGLRRAKGPPPSAAVTTRNADVVKALQAGESVDSIAAAFGLSKMNIYKIGQLHGVGRRSIARQAQEAARAKVISAITEGEPVSKVAARLGVSSERIYQITRKAGLTIPKKPRAAKVPKPKADKPNQTSCSRLPVGESGRDRMAARESVSQTPLAKPQTVAKVGDEKRSPTPAAPQAAAAVSGFYSEAATKARAQEAGRKRARAESDAEAQRKLARRAARVEFEEQANEEFQAALARAKARRESGVEVIMPKGAVSSTSGARLAEALRRRRSPAAKSKAVPAQLTPAPSREECPRCGIPGWKGCDHFLPCEDQPPVASKEGDTSPRLSTRFTGRRQGLSVLSV